jgi:hypothetical protein
VARDAAGGVGGADEGRRTRSYDAQQGRRGATMTRRVIFVALGISLLCSATVPGSDRPAAIREVEAAIRRDLPPGTLRSTVLDFLQRHRIAHHDSKDIRYFNGPRTVWGLLERSHGLFVIDTVLTFEFDAEDKLVSYSSREQLVGP